jgi:hypothetical protein
MGDQDLQAHLIDLLKSGALYVKGVQYEPESNRYWSLRVDFLLDPSQIPRSPEEEFRELLRLAFVK